MRRDRPSQNICGRSEASRWLSAIRDGRRGVSHPRLASEMDAACRRCSSDGAWKMKQPLCKPVDDALPKQGRSRHRRARPWPRQVHVGAHPAPCSGYAGVEAYRCMHQSAPHGGALGRYALAHSEIISETLSGSHSMRGISCETGHVENTRRLDTEVASAPHDGVVEHVVGSGRPSLDSCGVAGSAHLADGDDAPPREMAAMPRRGLSARCEPNEPLGYRTSRHSADPRMGGASYAPRSKCRGTTPRQTAPFGIGKT